MRGNVKLIGEKMNWISTSKVKPAYFAQVLAWVYDDDLVDNGYCISVYIGKYKEDEENGEEGWFPSNIDWPECSKETKIDRPITHWMPLPDGPKNDR